MDIYGGFPKLGDVQGLGIRVERLGVGVLGLGFRASQKQGYILGGSL